MQDGTNRWNFALVTSVTSTLPVILEETELVVKWQGLICRELILAYVLFSKRLLQESFIILFRYGKIIGNNCI